MSRKCLLFAYGLLRPDQRPPRSMSAHWADAVRGELYDLGEEPAAVKVDTAPDWIDGETLEIDAAELEALDDFENVDGGDYARRLVTTREGYVAWIYEYKREIPVGLKPIGKWRP